MKLELRIYLSEVFTGFILTYGDYLLIGTVIILPIPKFYSLIKSVISGGENTQSFSKQLNPQKNLNPYKIKESFSSLILCEK
ncbi:MAG TPA: hypothetical protein DIT97_11485 [Gimesia maris]|uniref:Uncharacterized protein n=1 Tax=Gimesia maris TaxID=122 RepID=A0A3D3R6J7_9PLAN|nr:hypothetical protein [Gimesia maris]